jgi:hypothetical protein
MKRERDIYHHGLKHIPIMHHLPDPPSFSLSTTFNDLTKKGEYLEIEEDKMAPLSVLGVLRALSVSTLGALGVLSTLDNF